jgi:hypothetical protein
MSASLSTLLLHSLRDLRSEAHAAPPRKSGTKKPGDEAGRGGDPQERLRKALGDFIGCLKEWMQEDRAALCRVHRPKGVTWAGESALCYSDFATKMAVQHYDLMIETTSGDPPYSYEYDAMEYEETEGLDELIAQWSAIAREMRKLPRVDAAELEQLAEHIRQEERMAAKAPKVTPPEPLVYKLPKQADRNRSSGHTALDRDMFRLPPVRSRGRQPAENDEATDAFYFVRGEPAKSFVTKIGGLPYRPAEVPWPSAEEGQPMTFLAQFCFSGSTDLVGALPGDVLLVFAEDNQAYYPSPYGDDNRFRFEWYPLGLPNLLTASQVPETSWKLVPCAGVVQRTSESRGSYEGVKIGGAPHWTQVANEVDESDWPGAFLCALGPLRFLPESASCPPMQPPRQYGKGYELLELGDGGTLNFFHGGGGAIHWRFDCY